MIDELVYHSPAKKTDTGVLSGVFVVVERSFEQCKRRQMLWASMPLDISYLGDRLSTVIASNRSRRPSGVLTLKTASRSAMWLSFYHR